MWAESRKGLRRRRRSTVSWELPRRCRCAIRPVSTISRRSFAGKPIPISTASSVTSLFAMSPDTRGLALAGSIWLVFRHRQPDNLGRPLGQKFENVRPPLAHRAPARNCKGIQVFQRGGRLLRGKTPRRRLHAPRSLLDSRLCRLCILPGK
jgi:hypothetical protein